MVKEGFEGEVSTGKRIESERLSQVGKGREERRGDEQKRREKEEQLNSRR